MLLSNMKCIWICSHQWIFIFDHCTLLTSHIKIAYWMQTKQLMKIPCRAVHSKVGSLKSDILNSMNRFFVMGWKFTVSRYDVTTNNSSLLHPTPHFFFFPCFVPNHQWPNLHVAVSFCAKLALHIHNSSHKQQSLHLTFCTIFCFSFLTYVVPHHLIVVITKKEGEPTRFVILHCKIPPVVYLLIFKSQCVAHFAHDLVISTVITRSSALVWLQSGTKNRKNWNSEPSLWPWTQQSNFFTSHFIRFTMTYH